MSCEHRAIEHRGTTMACAECGITASSVVEVLHGRIGALRGVVGPRLPAPGFFTRDELLRCLDREIVMRERVYPKRVIDRKMRPTVAQDEIAMMKAIRHTIAQVLA